MTFMIVNTGRAASRAFYLNLRAQPGVYVASRHDLDRAITGVVRHGDVSSLDVLSAAYVMSTRREPVPAVGLVFHGVRPRLALPFDADANMRLLEEIRDRFEVTHVFAVVRDPLEVFASEMNRRLAGMAGDWSFFDFGTGWRSPIALDDLERLSQHPTPVSTPHIDLDHIDDEALAGEISHRTGKAAMLVDIFTSVFGDVRVLPYQWLLSNPIATFEAIAHTTGWEFTERELVEAKLNGLANRLLVYNPLSLDIGGMELKLRFEVDAVIGRCEDWGTHVRLPVDCDRALPNATNLVGSRVGLGVDRSDLARLPAAVQTAVTSVGFAEHVVASVAPVYDDSFARTEAIYRRDVYRTRWSGEAQAAFTGENSADMARCRRLIADADWIVPDDAPGPD